MGRTTSFQLSEELDDFITDKVRSGAYHSASEVVRTALERFAEEDRRERELDAALERAMKGKRAAPGVFDRLRKRHGIR